MNIFIMTVGSRGDVQPYVGTTDEKSEEEKKKSDVEKKCCANHG